MSKTVTTTSIVERLEDVIDETWNDKKLDTKQRADIVYKMTGRQLQAGALNLAYQKAVAKMPEESSETVLRLTGK